MIVVLFLMYFISVESLINHENIDTQLLMAKVIVSNGKQSYERTNLTDFIRQKSTFNFEPFQVKDLTKDGEFEMYNFGIKLRKRYNITQKNKSKNGKNQVVVQSTSHKGCQKSAKIIEAAINKENLNKNWTESDLENITNSTADRLLKYFYDNNDTCKIHLTMLQNYIDNYQAYKPYYQTRDTIAENLGINKASIKPEHLWQLYDYYQAMRFSNQSLPNWLTEDMLLDMEESNELLMKILFQGSYSKKTSGGVYANMIFDDFDKKKADKSQNPTIHILCAQNIIVTAALSAVSVFKGTASKICGQNFEMHVPKHGAAFIVELHQAKDEQHIVKVFYWKPGADKPQQIKHNYCEQEDCTLEEFKSFLNTTRISEDELKTCGVPKNIYKSS